MWSMSKRMQEVGVFLMPESSFPGPHRGCPCKQAATSFTNSQRLLTATSPGSILSLDTEKESMP